MSERIKSLKSSSDEHEKSEVLPDEVVLCILAWLPLAAQARLRLVCRAWNHFFLKRTRPFLFVKRSGLNVKNYWSLLDPLTLRCQPLHRPLAASTASYYYDHPLAASTASGDVVFLVYIGNRRPCFFLLNLHTMQWKELPCPNLYEHHHFSVAILDGYIYIVAKHGKCVQRLKLQGDQASWMWECLPQMHARRTYPVVLAFEECIWVIGGVGEFANSGEVWDPRLKEWNLIPELLPSDVFGTSSVRINVAVAHGKLYAIARYSQAIVYYEPATKVWRNLCLLSSVTPLQHRYKDGYCLLAVGNELWLVAYDSLRGMAYIVTTEPMPFASALHEHLNSTRAEVRFSEVVVYV